MKKYLYIILSCMLLMSGCAKKMSIEEFPHLTFAQLDEKIANDETMIVYFGWTQNCGDSLNFQDNYLVKYASDDNKLKEVYIVDLDVENPEGLDDKEKRADMNDKYDVMYSPTLISYEKGMPVELISWTPATTDKDTGIMQSSLDNFFMKYEYILEATKK